MGVLMANYCELFAHRYEVRDGAMAENEFGSFSVKKDDGCNGDVR